LRRLNDELSYPPYEKDINLDVHIEIFKCNILANEKIED
jgi:hypothetical protein